MTIYDIVVKNQQNQDVKLADYQGKVLLIVNTATGCGFTPQYDGLQKLYDTYKDQGFFILDFPCLPPLYQNGSLESTRTS